MHQSICIKKCFNFLKRRHSNFERESLTNFRNIFGYCIGAVILFSGYAEAQKIFIEDSSLVIVEMESASLTNGWKAGNDVVEGVTIQYLEWIGDDYFSLPGNQLLEYQVLINHPGVYRFIWNNKVGKGQSKTEHNDSWLKISGAADFFGDKNGHIVHPRGVCRDDCPKGAGADGWFKIYSSGTTDWSWSTRTSDNDPHMIYAKFDTTGIYTIQISARSSGHRLNRLVLFKETVYSQNDAAILSKPESNIQKAYKQ